MRLLVVLAWLLTGAAAAAQPAPPLAAEVFVTHGGDGWTADFHFRRRSPVWGFLRSALTREGERPWRPQSWRIVTPGVRLERRGAYDVLVAAHGGTVPQRLLVRFTPAPVDLIADYDPALVFTDGSVALYTEQFSVFPYASAEAVAGLPADRNQADVHDTRTRVRFRDANGPILAGGARLSVVIRDGGLDSGTYVLFGPIRPVVTDAMVEIVDPQLPEWIRSSLNRAVPEIVGRYAAVLGPPPGSKPTIMVSWAGPTPRRTSMGGSVLPDLVTLTYEGEGVLTENSRSRVQGLLFIAHESAHFWLGNLVHYAFSHDAWITEGGADLLAFRTVAAVDSDYDWRSAINRSIADCVTLSTNRGVESAETRNEQRAYYACGAVFGLVVEAASHRPFIQFVKDLIESNRSDATVTRAEWLAQLDRVSGDPSLSGDIGGLLDHGAANPKEAFASLFTRAGVAFVRANDGMPRVQ